MRRMLRAVRDADLPLLFEQWMDPVAVHMAAFTAPDHMDRDAFAARTAFFSLEMTIEAFLEGHARVRVAGRRAPRVRP
jgi:hypothetical protein